MARPPVFPAEEKVRIVLSILAGEVTVAEAARRAKLSEQSVGNWKRQFLESGWAGLVAGKSGPSAREAQLQAEVAELTQALGEPRSSCGCGRSRRGPAGPFADLEVIRIQAGMPTTSFCALIGSILPPVTPPGAPAPPGGRRPPARAAGSGRRAARLTRA